MDDVQTPSLNGTTPAMTQVTDVLRDAIATHSARVDQLAEELAASKRELTNYQKALALLDGSPRPGKPGRKPAGSSTAGTKIGPERLSEVEQAVRGYVTEHGDVEFRQIDIREYMNNAISSGISSMAFKQLREREVIRAARKDGINTYFRLTRTALAES
jgi:hypothetical protein